MSRDQQRHTLALMGTPRSRRQLSLEGAGSIRRPAGWLLPNKPASPNGPVRRAARTPCWAGHRGTSRSPDASPGRGGAGAWREEAMMGRPFRHWATPHPRPPPAPPRTPSSGKSYQDAFLRPPGLRELPICGLHGCLPWKVPRPREQWGPCRELLSNSPNL